MQILQRLFYILLRYKIFLTLPVFLLIPAFLATMNNRLTVFPLREPFTIEKYCDSIDNGNSSITRFRADSSQITFEFTLRKGFESPYAGFQINVNRDTAFLDISQYDFLNFKLSPVNTKKINCYCKLFMPGISVLGNDMTHRFLEEEIDLSPKKENYSIKLKKMRTSVWWLKDNNYTEAQIGEPDFSKCINISIESASYTPADIQYKLIVYEIFLTKDNTFLYGLTLIGILIYYALYWFFVRKRTIGGSSIIIPYKEIELGNYIDEEAKRITDCIIKNFNDSELTVTKVGIQAGIASSKIPMILKNKYNQSFKQYLNQLRLTEAKRLIRETDRPISDIAYHVGYRNVTHFHRIFKLFEKVSPNEYRKLAENSKDES